MSRNLLFISILLFIITFNSSAQDGANDVSFNPTDVGFGQGDGSDNSSSPAMVESVVLEDGKILAFGTISVYNSVFKDGIIRLNADGTVDPSFNPGGTGAGGRIHDVEVLDDGKILAVGSFTRYNYVHNGPSYGGIIRLNSDGTPDESFNLYGAGANGEIYTVEVKSDGSLVIGGRFSSYNGSPVSNLAGLTPDGLLDYNFYSGTGTNGPVNDIQIENDGNILIGGDFSSYNDTACDGLIRLSSSGGIEYSLITDRGLYYPVQHIRSRQDGSIVVCTLLDVVLLNSNGMWNNSFNTGGCDRNIYAFDVQSDGKVLVGGYFATCDGNTSNGIARLNPDGSFDNSFISKLAPDYYGYEQPISGITVQPDYKILLGGHFYSYDTVPVNNFIRLNPDGELDQTFNPNSGANGPVQVTAVSSDGKIVIGGSFSSFNRKMSGGIERLNSDGTVDLTFRQGAGIPLYYPNSVHALAILEDGSMLIGGVFPSYDHISVNNIVRLNTDGAPDASFNSGSGTNGAVYAIALQDNGKILIGGKFTTYNGNSVMKIARLNADGTLDNTFNPGGGVSGEVRTIAIQSDGKILLGGAFSSFNGTSSPCLVRLNPDGSLDNTFDTGTGFDYSVLDIELTPDEKIYAVGKFYTFNGLPRKGIIRLNNNGSEDTDFNVGTGASDVNAILPLMSGQVIVAGQFRSIDGVESNCLARLNENGILDGTFDSGDSRNSAIYAITKLPDDNLLIAGNFTVYNGVGRNRVARVMQSIITGAIPAATSYEPMTVFPNPATDQVTLSIAPEIRGKVKCMVTNVQGKILIEEQFITGGYSREFDFRSLSKGIYTIQIVTENGVFAKQIVLH